MFKHMNQLHALYKAINHSKVEIGELEKSMHGHGNSNQFSVLDIGWCNDKELRLQTLMVTKLAISVTN